MDSLTLLSGIIFTSSYSSEHADPPTVSSYQQCDEKTAGFHLDALRICISLSLAPYLRNSLSLPLPDETTSLCDNLFEATNMGDKPDIGDETSSQKGLDG